MPVEVETRRGSEKCGRPRTQRRGGIIGDQCAVADSVYGRRNHRATGAFFVKVQLVG